MLAWLGLVHSRFRPRAKKKNNGGDIKKKHRNTCPYLIWSAELKLEYYFFFVFHLIVFRYIQFVYLFAYMIYKGVYEFEVNYNIVRIMTYGLSFRFLAHNASDIIKK